MGTYWIVTTISVCIGTYGIEPWKRLAQERAIPSVEGQTYPAVDCQWVHGQTLHEARNQAAADATGEWLCFLDADDELDRCYLEAMTRALEHDGSTKRLLQPATIGVYGDGGTDLAPVLHPPKPLHIANFLIIGTVVRRDQFLQVGGFADLVSHEDWDLWLRCWIDGAVVQPVPDAIYRVHVRPNGRNSAGTAPHVKVINDIRAKYRNQFPPSIVP
jgi:glycosyltransferase involved in cell wall biosynthesis